jgi:hypothetical protein
MLNKLFDERMVPLVLLALALLSYGLLVPFLGYYWDDWPAVWVSHSLGPSGLRVYAAYDRPFQGWLFSATASLLGVAPLHWHIFAFFVRWLSAVAVWWTLRGVWPERSRENACVAFLFLVYPGFPFQPVAWIFGQSATLPLLFSAFSLGAMIWAIRAPRWFWPLTCLAIPSSALSMMITEYFFGLELLRPVLLWHTLDGEKRNARQRLRRVVSNWLPYLVLTVAYVIWRLFLFKSARPETDQSRFFSNLAAHPLGNLIHRPFIIFRDIVIGSVMAWGRALRPDMFQYQGLAWTLMVMSGVGIFIYLYRVETNSTTAGVGANPAPWAKQALIFGIIAMFVGELPIWFGDRFLEVEGTYSRHTLTVMFGAPLVVAALIHLLVRTRLQQIVLLSIAVASAVGFHFVNGQYYRHNWSDQKSLFWQLSWRAPALKPGTSVLMRQTLLAGDDDALAAPLNFVYSPQNSSPRLAYWFFHLPQQFIPVERDPFLIRLEGLTGDGHLKRTLRNISFEGHASNSLLIRFAPRSCLRVIDISRDDLPQLDPVERAAAIFSHIDQIDVNPDSPAGPPAEIMGHEPEHDWCYYFEKAELARQIGNWQAVAELADKARALGFEPSDATEWLPFIEGYANLKRYNDAKTIIRLAMKSPSVMQPALLNLLNRLDSSGSPEPDRQAFVAAMKSEKWHRQDCVNCMYGY